MFEQVKALRKNEVTKKSDGFDEMKVEDDDQNSYSIDVKKKNSGSSAATMVKKYSYLD